MDRLLILLLSVFHVESGQLIISRPGRDVSINCPCLKAESCFLEYVRWVRFDPNGTFEVIDTNCQKPLCRFSSERFNDFEVKLTISGVEEQDSGRYYCREVMSTNIDFKAGDTLLHVGDEGIWTNSSEVKLFFERFSGSPEEQRREPRRYAELRCLVTGLGAPVTDILWRSSGGKNRTGQILGSLKTNSGFQVMSQLRILIPINDQLYRKSWDHNNSHNALQHEESDKDLDVEEWWCEVHAGGNKTHRSNTFSLINRNGDESVSEWCAALSYAAIALSTVCVILLLILISHWLCYLHTGSELQAEVQNNEQPEVTYTDLQFKQSSKSKSGRRHQHVKSQEDASLYSQVKCSGSSATNGSPLTDTQEDEQPGVTYTHLKFKQPSKPKSGRQHRERRVNAQEETSLYSQLKTE